MTLLGLRIERNDFNVRAYRRIVKNTVKELFEKLLSLKVVARKFHSS